MWYARSQNMICDILVTAWWLYMVADGLVRIVYQGISNSHGACRVLHRSKTFEIIAIAF